VVDAAFWRTHLWLPLLVFCLALAGVSALGLDFRVADAWYSASAGKFPARDAHLTKIVLHDGGNRLIHFIAIGKQLTNMDCPWAVTRFGGDRPYVSLFSDRPGNLPRGGCFPGAHSSGAFALFAFYFVWRRKNPRRARVALACAAALGTVYAATQWVRGAHFVSHDIWAAMLAWLVCLGCYLMFDRKMWPQENDAGETQSLAAMAGN